MKKTYYQLLLLSLWLPVILLLVRAALAQTPLGSIDVYVMDPNRAVVRGATVTCMNEATGYSDQCETDSSGYCRAKNLPVGSYMVIVDAHGFQQFETFGVKVTVANETRVQVPLSLSAIPGTVTVSEESPETQVETQSTALRGVITERQIRELPLNNRNFMQLATLVPGVTADAGSGTGATSFGSFSVDGNRTRSNNFLLDGVDVGDSYRNSLAVNEPGIFGAPTTVLPTEAVAEFGVSTNFSSDSGRNSGSVVNVSIRSGDNKIRGSLFEFFRNDALNARDSFNSIGPKNKLRYNDFGFSLGGPLKKYKAFFFVAYEGQRERKEITTLSAVPTDSDFAQAIATLGGDPAIPLEQNPVVNPVIRSLFALCRSSERCPGGTALWPRPTPGRGGQVLNSLAPADGSNRSDGLVVKGDFNLNARNSFSGHYSFGDAQQSFPLALAGGDDLPNTSTREPSRSQLASGSYLLKLSPNKSNELRVGWNRYTRRFLDEDKMGVGNPAQTIGLNTGVTHPRDFGLPHFVVRNFAFLGSSPFSNPRGRVATDWHVAESLSWKLGRHDLKIGYEFRRASVNSFNDVNFRGKLEFASLQDFLAGKVARGTILKGNSDRTTVESLDAAYVHDSFRLVPRFTLNSGVRWEFVGVLHEENMLLSRYDPSRGLVIPQKLYEPDLNNFSPRAGFAWDVTGRQKTVLRAGAGVYFDAFPQDFFVGQIQFNTFNAGVAYNAIPERPILAARSSVRIIEPGQPVFQASTFAPDTRDATTVAKITTPYVLNYNVNLQQGLFRKTVLQIAYVGSGGRKLFRTRDINAPLVLGASRLFDNAAVLSAVAPNQPFIINQIETSATSNYNSLQVSFTQRSRHVINTVQWTWSHSIDDASDGIDSVPNLASPDNPHAPGRERASSNFDTRHRFVWGFTYDLPAPIALRRSMELRRLGEGWRIGGILTLSSGQPYHVNFGDEFDSQGAYDFILRPDIVGNPLFGTSSPDRLLNLAAFQVPCTLDGRGTDVSNCLPGTLHFGNLPRNAFVGPNYGNLDFSISKTTHLTERLALQLKAEFFNLTNHPNFSLPLVPRFIARASLKGIDTNGRGGARGTGCNTTAASNDCYLPSTRTSNGPRSIQFSIRMTF